MAQLLWSALHLSAVLVCASALTTASVLAVMAQPGGGPSWLAEIIPIAPADPMGTVGHTWCASWRLPHDGGPGRVPFRLLRRIKLSRPIHAP